MAFNFKEFSAATDAGPLAAPRSFTYHAGDDTQSVVTASGYFNELRHLLRVNDLIVVNLASGSNRAVHQFRIAGITDEGVVTTSTGSAVTS